MKNITLIYKTSTLNILFAINLTLSSSLALPLRDKGKESELIAILSFCIISIANIFYNIEDIHFFYIGIFILFLLFSSDIGWFNVMKLIMISAGIKLFLYFSSFTLANLGLDIIVRFSFTCIIVLFIIYGILSSNNTILHICKLFKKIFVLCVFWSTISISADISFTNTFILFMGNYVFIGLDGVDLSPIESLKETIYDLFKNCYLGYGGDPGGGGKPNFDLFALLKLNTDSIIKLDDTKEIDSDLYPGGGNYTEYIIPDPTRADLTHINMRNPIDLDYSDLHKFINSDTIRHLSKTAEIHNSSIIKSDLPMNHTAVKYLNNTTSLCYRFYGESPLDYFIRIKSISSMCIWEFDILTKAKFYIENKHLDKNFLTWVYKSSHDFWLKRQIYPYSGFVNSISNNMSNGWVCLDYTNDKIFYSEICRDLIWVELTILFSKSLAEYLINNNTNLHYIDQGSFDKILLSVYDSNSKLYPKAFECLSNIHLYNNNQWSNEQFYAMYYYSYGPILDFILRDSFYKLWTKGFNLCSEFAYKKIDYFKMSKLIDNRFVMDQSGLGKYFINLHTNKFYSSNLQTKGLDLLNNFSRKEVDSLYIARTIFNR